MTEIETLLLESNDMLRSAAQIAKRRGENTGWDWFEKRLGEVLERQHSLTNHLRDQRGVIATRR